MVGNLSAVEKHSGSGSEAMIKKTQVQNYTQRTLGEQGRACLHFVHYLDLCAVNRGVKGTSEEVSACPSIQQLPLLLE